MQAISRTASHLSGKRAIALFAVLAAASVAWTFPPDRPESKGPSFSIVGEWRPTFVVARGIPVPDDERDKIVFRFAADTMTVIKAGAAAPDQALFHIDWTKKPATIDMESDGRKTQGIVQLDGDRLKKCTSRAGGERPTAFASPEGSTVIYMELTRIKTEPKK